MTRRATIVDTQMDRTVVAADVKLAVAEGIQELVMGSPHCVDANLLREYLADRGITREMLGAGEVGAAFSRMATRGGIRFYKWVENRDSVAGNAGKLTRRWVLADPKKLADAVDALRWNDPA